MRIFLFYAKKEAVIRLSLKYMVEKYVNTTTRFAQQLQTFYDLPKLDFH